MKSKKIANLSVNAETEAETEALAAQVARYAVAGDVIRLEGTLGMGKTTFARAFIRALAKNAELEVPSPTFTIAQPYHETRLPVMHVDAYRLHCGEELEELDLQNYFSHGVTLIEWASNVEEAMPKFEFPDNFVMESEEGDLLTITLADVEGNPEARKITLDAQGSWVPRFGLIDPATARQVTEAGRQNFLNKVCNMEEGVKLTPASSDCSFRTYYRLSKDGDELKTNKLEPSKLVMDAPYPMENVRPFVKMAKIWNELGCRTPKIYAQDTENGYLLLEDFGGELFSQGFNKNPEQKMAWLEATVDMLADVAVKVQNENLQNKLKNDDGVSVYSSQNAWAEASRYVDWYLPSERGEATQPDERAEFRQLWLDTYRELPEIPLTLSHWDFHSDNLIMTTSGETSDAGGGGSTAGKSSVGDGGDENTSVENTSVEISRQNIGVIDFQDCRIAPIAMDMACLLEDRCPIEKELKVELIERFLAKLAEQKIVVSLEDFMAWYDFMSLHRFFKITGLLVRLEERDKRENATARMPQIWETINRKFTREDNLARFEKLRKFVEQVNDNHKFGDVA